jgi:hypothetical protein
MRDKCKKCLDGEMVLKIEYEEFKYRGKPLLVKLPYHECNSCGFDIVSYDLSVQSDLIVKEAKEAQLLRAKYRKEIGETFKGMRK